jgi:hypothetical protein
MEHFVLYIKYHGNNQMCEIYLMEIFYTWGESISILLCGIREILQSLDAIMISAMINANITLPSWYIQ